MTGDEVLRYRKAQARTTNTPGDQRIEQRIFQFGWNTRAVIFEGHGGNDAMPLRADRHVGQRPSADGDPPRLTEHLNGVAGEVQERLHYLVAVQHERRQTRVVVAHDGDGFRRLHPQQVVHMLRQFVQVNLLLARWRVRAQQVVH